MKRSWPRLPIVAGVQILDVATARGLDLPDEHAGLARCFGWSTAADSYVEVIFGRELAAMAVEAAIVTGERPILPITAALDHRLRDEPPPLWREADDAEAFIIATPQDAPEDVA